MAPLFPQPITITRIVLRAHADETLSTTVSDLIIDKMINKFSEPLARLNNSITATKMFLDAAAQKQASGLLNLQESINQPEATAKSLADSADKISHAPIPGVLDDVTWPRLSACLTAATPIPPPGAQSPVGSHQADPKVVQRVALAAKQLLIEYGPLDAGEESPTSTVEAQMDMRKMFNGWINTHSTQESSDADIGTPPPPPPPLVCCVKHVNI